MSTPARLVTAAAARPAGQNEVGLGMQAKDKNWQPLASSVNVMISYIYIVLLGRVWSRSRPVDIKIGVVLSILKSDLLCNVLLVLILDLSIRAHVRTACNSSTILLLVRGRPCPGQSQTLSWSEADPVLVRGRPCPGQSQTLSWSEADPVLVRGRPCPGQKQTLSWSESGMSWSWSESGMSWTEADPVLVRGTLSWSEWGMSWLVCV